MRVVTAIQHGRLIYYVYILLYTYIFAASQIIQTHLRSCKNITVHTFKYIDSLKVGYILLNYLRWADLALFNNIKFK